MKMKVWGTTCVVPFDVPGNAAHNQQARVIVCACSQKRAVEVVNALGFGYETLSGFRAWWDETGNAVELATANGREGVWYAPDLRSGPFKPYSKKR